MPPASNATWCQSPAGMAVCGASRSAHTRARHIFALSLTEKFALNGIANELVNPHTLTRTRVNRKANIPLGLGFVPSQPLWVYFQPERDHPTGSRLSSSHPRPGVFFAMSLPVKAQPVSRVGPGYSGDVPEQSRVD